MSSSAGAAWLHLLTIGCRKSFEDFPKRKTSKAIRKNIYRRLVWKSYFRTVTSESFGNIGFIFQKNNECFHSRPFSAPAEFGSWDLSKWIDVDLLGSTFSNGSIVTQASHFDPSSFYGMIGLSNDISPVKLFGNFALKGYSPDDDQIQELERILHEQITPMTFPNFLRQMTFEGDQKNLSYISNEYLWLRNSIMDIPIGAFLNGFRHVDMLIVLDSSSNMQSIVPSVCHSDGAQN